MGAAVAWVLALALPVVPVVPAYPGAHTEAPPSVRLDADGSRVMVTRLVTTDSLPEVRRRLVVELGAGRVLSNVDDGARAVVVIGPGPGLPTVVAWRDAGAPETHLLVERKLGVASPTPASPAALGGSVPMPGGTVAGLPLYPFAMPEMVRQPVAGGVGGPSAISFTSSQPFPAVAAFYRALVPGAAVEAHAGGTDWLEIASSEPGGTSVQVLHEPGSPSVRITYYPRAP